MISGYFLISKMQFETRVCHFISIHKDKGPQEIWDKGRKLSKNCKWTFNLIRLFGKYFCEEFLVNGYNDSFQYGIWPILFLWKLSSVRFKSESTFVQNKMFRLQQLQTSFFFHLNWPWTKLIIYDFKMREENKIDSLVQKSSIFNWEKTLLYWDENSIVKEKSYTPHRSNKAIWR